MDRNSCFSKIVALALSPGSSGGKERICLQCRRPQFDSWVGKIPWRRNRLPSPVFLDFPCGLAGKESACNVGDHWVRSLGWEDPLEKEKATHSSILAWRIPQTVEAMGSQRVGTRLKQLSSSSTVITVGFPDSSAGKESACNAGDPSSIPGLGRSTREGIGYPLQYSSNSFWCFPLLWGLVLL